MKINMNANTNANIKTEINTKHKDEGEILMK
jgi:hypothetical protein